ncbi:MAG: 30S ribosomal protein S8 [Phycisphaeraceae bacterium]|nr:30S ribosomal protein S8 [Phycisphaeraceae bacterium]MBX3405761.1 30S ribosomal protein S8 [Phycisphaeraceae bacterium]
MAINDPISDMLTRIRNAAGNKSKTVECLNSKVCRGIADVLRDEGYIEGYEVLEDGRQGKIKVKLRYGPRGETVLHWLRRESKPGRRVYQRVDDLPRPLQGLGIAIVSTSRGVMSDRKARTERVGGELLCLVG